MQNDAVGTNNGTVYGATLTTDRFGSLDQAFDFNGTNTYIAFSQSTGNIPGATQMTISAWVTFSGAAAAQAFFGHWCNHSTYYGQNIGVMLYRQTGNSISISMTAGTGCFGTARLTTNSWHNIVFAFKGDEPLNVNRMRLFIDGQADTLDLTQPSSVPAVVGSLAVSTLLGARQEPRGNIEFYSGGIDDMRIYNRALSSDEVAQLYAIESGPEVDLIKSVKPSFKKPTLTTNYQMQLSADMKTWTNYGAAFTATNNSMVYPQNVDVDNWNSLYFRLHVSP